MARNQIDGTYSPPFRVFLDQLEDQSWVASVFANPVGNNTTPKYRCSDRDLSEAIRVASIWMLKMGARMKMEAPRGTETNGADGETGADPECPEGA